MTEQRAHHARGLHHYGVRLTPHQLRVTHLVLSQVAKDPDLAHLCGLGSGDQRILVRASLSVGRAWRTIRRSQYEEQQ